MPIQSLPNEILQNVLAHLIHPHEADIYNCLSVSKSFHAICSGPIFYEEVRFMKPMQASDFHRRLLQRPERQRWIKFLECRPEDWEEDECALYGVAAILQLLQVCVRLKNLVNFPLSIQRTDVMLYDISQLKETQELSV